MTGIELDEQALKLAVLAADPADGLEKNVPWIVLAYLHEVGSEPKVEAYRQALVEIRDRCARVVDARAIAARVLGDG